MALSAEDIAKRKASILTSMADGLSAIKACKVNGISHYHFTLWMQSDAEFALGVGRQQETLIEDLFDRLDDALDTYPNPQQAKVFSENIKWKLAKLKPERFGDSLNLKTLHTVDLTDRFARALDRLTSADLRPPRDPTARQIAQAIDIIDVTPDPHTDSQSVSGVASTSARPPVTPDSASVPVTTPGPDTGGYPPPAPRPRGQKRDGT